MVNGGEISRLWNVARQILHNTVINILVNVLHAYVRNTSQPSMSEILVS